MISQSGSGGGGGMSWSNMGGDQPRFAPQNGRLVTQQPIMTNVGIHKGLHEWRAKDAGDIKIPNSQIMGRQLSTGQGDAYDLMHVKTLDLVFTHKKQLQTRDIDPYNENRVNGIVTWNAYKIEPHIRTQAAFEDGFRCLGYSARAWLYGKPDQPETGVAVMVHGSKGFFYRGWKNKPLYPGDRIRWRLRSIFAEKREEEAAMLGADRDHPVERLDCVLEPMSYGDAHYFVQYELTQSFDDRNRDRFLYTKARPGASEAVSRDQFAAIALRTLLQMHSVATLAVFMLYTGIELPTPGNGNVSAIDENIFNANHAVENTLFKDLVRLGGRTVVRDPSGNGSLRISDVPIDQALRRRRAHQLEFWAAKFGCAPTAKPVAGDHAHNMINAALAITLQPLIMDRGLAAGVDIRKFFPAEMQLAAQRKSLRSDDHGVGKEWNEKSVLGCLGYLQNSAATDAYHAIGEAIERIQDRCVGTSLSYTVAGDWGDEYH